MTLNSRTNRRLEEIAALGQTRKMAVPKGVDLSSNDYLGLARDERVLRAMVKGVESEGAGSTASRLLRGHRAVFEDVERQFAEFKSTERSLYFATGFQANIGLLQTFLEDGDLVFSDELNHASIIDGIRSSKAGKVIFKHRDPADLELKLRAYDCSGQRFLVTESLFSMNGDFAPLDEYARICADTGTNLVVDEAHAVGIYGKRGSGLVEEFGVEGSVFLSVNTAGKALGVSGAFVAGPIWAIEYLVQRCRVFIFSTAPAPSLALALSESLRIVENDTGRRRRLFEICRYFFELLSDNGFEVAERASQIVPVILGSSDKTVRISEALQSKGYDVRAIRPPTVPEGTSRLRISLNVGLQEKVLSDFVEHLQQALR